MLIESQIGSGRCIWGINQKGAAIETGIENIYSANPISYHIMQSYHLFILESISVEAQSSNAGIAGPSSKQTNYVNKQNKFHSLFLPLIVYTVFIVHYSLIIFSVHHCESFNCWLGHHQPPALSSWHFLKGKFLEQIFVPFNQIASIITNLARTSRTSRILQTYQKRKVVWDTNRCILIQLAMFYLFVCSTSSWHTM